MQKPNDWFATRLFQPDYTLVDFYAQGITPDNSDLKPKEDYRDIPEVQEFFKDDSGKFDEKKFDNFYETTLALYNQYDNDEVEKRLLESYVHDPYEWYTPGNLTFREVGSKIVLGTNPLMQSQGVKGLLYEGPGQFSIREIAQNELVKDQEGNTLNWTPNDKGGLFKSLTRPTLVLAQYDEDEDEIINGQVVHHKKGDLKYNENGRPYYEELGDREMYGKDLLRYTDTLTIDGKGLNAIDVFDNDGLDKSIGGTLAKTALTIGPLLIPGVGPVYGAIRAALATSQVLPILGKTLNSIFTGDNDNDFGKAMNKMEAWTSQFTSSVSDHSREKQITLENFGSLINQIGGQLFEQRAVGYIPRLLNKYGDVTKNTRAGQNLAQTYMAVTSAKETYQSFKEAGATDRMAGIAMAANIFALYKLMDMDYFRKTLFKGSWLDDDVIKNPMKGIARQYREILGGVAEDGTQEGSKKVFRIFSKEFYKNIGKALNKSEFVARSLSEGVEEVMEEVTSDLSKVLTLGLESIGVPVGERKLDFGFSPEEILSRYAMTFAGGTIGGALFQGFGKWEKFIHPELAAAENLEDLEKVTYFIANNRAEELRDYARQWYKKGKLGSTNLATFDGHETKLPGKEGEWIANVDSRYTQNDAVYNALMNHIDYIENLMSEEGLVGIAQKSPAIFGKLPESFKELSDENKRATIVNMVSAQSNMLRDFSRLGAKIIQKRAEIDKLINQINSTRTNDSAEEKAKATEKINNSLKIKELQTDLANLRSERDAILNGEKNDWYVGRGLFALDEPVVTAFSNFSKENFAQSLYSINYGSLTDDQKKIVDDKFADYAAENGKYKYDIAFEIYNKLLERNTPELTNLNTKLKVLKKNKNYTDSLYGAERNRILDEIEKLTPEYLTLLAKKDLTPEEETRKNELEKQLIEKKAQKENLEAHPELFFENIAAKDTDELELQNYLLNTLRTLADQDAKLKEIAKIESLPKDQLAKNKTFESFAEILFNDPYWRAEFNLEPDRYLNQVLDLRDRFKDIRDKQELRVTEEYGKVGNLLKRLYTNYKSSKIIVSNDAGLNRFYDWVRNNYLSKSSTEDRSFNAVNEWWNKHTEITPEDWEDYTKPRANGITYEDDNMLEIGTGSPIQKRFIKNIDSFINTFGKDNKQALKFLQDAIDILDNETNLDSESKEYLLNSVLPKIGDQRIDDYIKEMDEIRKDIEYSPFNEWFKSFSTELTGEKLPILDIIKSEELRLAGAPNIFEYKIENEFVENELKNAITLLDTAIAMITGSYDGLNASINKYRKQLSKPELAILEDGPAQMLYQEAIKLKSKIEVLLQFNKINGQNQLEVQKKIQANMRPKFIKLITSPIYNDVIKEELGDEYDLADLWTNIAPSDLDFKTITKDNVQGYEKYFIEFETAVYNKFKDLSTDQLKKLYKKLFTSDIAKMVSGKLTDDSDVELSSYDAAVYLTTIISINSNDYYYRLKEILSQEEFDKAPLFAQEFAIRTAYANSLHPEKFNMLLDLMHEITPENDILKKKSLLYNMSFIFGGAGVGKTVVIARILARLLDDPDHEIHFLAPSEIQAEKLRAACELGKSKVYTQYNIFKEITTNPNGIEPQNIEREEKAFIKRKDIDAKNTDSIFSATIKHKFLFIDEVACFTSVELDLLSRWAQNNGIMIIGLGDRKQTSAKVYYQKGTNSEGKPIINKAYAGIEDCLYIKTPDLTASLRGTNGAKIDNYNILDFKLSNILLRYQEHPEWPSNTLSTETDAEFKDSIPLKWYEDEAHSRIIGEKPVKDSDELIADINKAKAFGGTIAIYADDPSKYTAFKGNPNITILPSENINGGEYDYVFVDIDWKKKGDVGGNNFVNHFTLLQDFYTVTQRSRVATVFINNGLINEEGKKGFLNIDSDKNVNVNNLPPLTKNKIDDFKEWRLSGLQDLKPSEDYEKNLTPDEAKRNTEKTPKTGEEPKNRSKPGEEPKGKTDDGSGSGPAVSTPTITKIITTPEEWESTKREEYINSVISKWKKDYNSIQLKKVETWEKLLDKVEKIFPRWFNNRYDGVNWTEQGQQATRDAIQKLMTEVDPYLYVELYKQDFIDKFTESIETIGPELRYTDTWNTIESTLTPEKLGLTDQKAFDRLLPHVKKALEVLKIKYNPVNRVAQSIEEWSKTNNFNDYLNRVDWDLVDTTSELRKYIDPLFHQRYQQEYDLRHHKLTKEEFDKIWDVEIVPLINNFKFDTSKLNKTEFLNVQSADLQSQIENLINQITQIYQNSYNFDINDENYVDISHDKFNKLFSSLNHEADNIVWDLNKNDIVKQLQDTITEYNPDQVKQAINKLNDQYLNRLFHTSETKKENYRKDVTTELVKKLKSLKPSKSPDEVYQEKVELVKQEWIKYLSSNPDFKKEDYWKKNSIDINSQLRDIALKQGFSQIEITHILEDFLKSWKIINFNDPINREDTPVNQSNNDFVTNDDEYYDFLFSKDFINFEQLNEHSLLNLFGKNITLETYTNLVNFIESIVKLNADIKNYIPQIRTILRADAKQRDNKQAEAIKFTQILEDSTTEVSKYIRPYKDKGMLYLDITRGTETYSIPISIVNAKKFGKYTGDLTQIQRLHFAKSGSFIGLDALQKKYPALHIGSNWGILSISNPEDVINDPNLSPNTRKFLNGQNNNGKVFALVTSNKLDTDQQLSSYWKDGFGEGEGYDYIDDSGKTVHILNSDYTYSNHDRIPIMGIQKLVPLSDVVRYATAMSYKIKAIQGLFSDSQGQQYLKDLGLTYDENGILQDIDILSLGGNPAQLNAISKFEDIIDNKVQILPFDRLGKLTAAILSNNLKDENLQKQIRGNVISFVNKTPSKDGRQNVLRLFGNVNGENKSFVVKYNHNTKRYEVFNYDTKASVLKEKIKEFSGDAPSFLLNLNQLVSDLEISPDSIQMHLGNTKQNEKGAITVFNTIANEAITRLFSNIKNINAIDSIIEDNSQFTYGVYVNDNADGFYEGSTYYRKYAGNKSNYMTDADIWYFPVYSIDESKIDTDTNLTEDTAKEGFKTKIETLKQTLKDNGFNDILKDYDFAHDTNLDYETDFQKWINVINRDLHDDYVKGDKYPRINEDGTFEGWIKNSQAGFRNAYEKLYGFLEEELVIPLTDITKSVTNFAIFAITDRNNLVEDDNSISLKDPISKDNSTFWTYIKIGDNIEIAPTNTYESWKSLYDYINNLNIPNKVILSSYIENLYTEITPEQDQQLQQFAQENPEIYKNFKELLLKHLQDKLQQEVKEC